MKNDLKIFGQDGKHLCDVLEMVLPELRGVSIDWGVPHHAHLLKENPLEANRQYCLELLGRAYIAAAATLLRTSVWTEGIQSSYQSHNYLSFSASLRGLVESVADSMHALEPVPLTLAQASAQIKAAMSTTNVNEFVIIPEVEDKLIHFTYARKVKKGEEVPAGHRALQTREYIDVLKRFNPKLETLYIEMCEATHPASKSVTWMLDQTPGIPWRIGFIGKDKSFLVINAII